MPIFEYTCQTCAAEFELLVRGSERPQCPHCDGQRLNKHLSVPAVHGSSSAGPSLGSAAAGPT